MDGLIAQIEEAGGTRTADPMTMEGMPVFGYFTDPSGVHMGLLGPIEPLNPSTGESQ